MKIKKELKEKIIKEFNIAKRTIFYYQKNEKRKKFLEAFILYIKLKELNIVDELEKIEALTILCCNDKEKRNEIKKRINNILEAINFLEDN